MWPGSVYLFSRVATLVTAWLIFCHRCLPRYRRERVGRLSTPFHKYAHVRCAALGLGRGATKEHTRQRSVTEEQRSPRPKATQPFGRQFFLAQTSWLAPCRPLPGMRVARASSGPKIPCRERVRIYEMEYLAQQRLRGTSCPGKPVSRIINPNRVGAIRASVWTRVSA